MTTIASSWMKSVEASVASTSTTVDPQAETLRLFQEHGTPLFRFCRSVLRDGSDAEDVVQDTFLKLLHHLQHAGDRRNLKSWLFTVAANACRDRTRWRVRWLPWTAERDDRAVVPIEPVNEDAGRARKAFRLLAPRDRLLLSWLFRDFRTETLRSRPGSASNRSAVCWRAHWGWEEGARGKG